MTDLSAQDAAAHARARLRSDLTSSMRARNALETSVLRAVIAALDNAQAAAVGGMHDKYVEHEFGDPAAEVPRLTLDAGQVRRLFEQEVRDRREAAEQFERLGKSEQAARLHAEADIIAKYIED